MSAELRAEPRAATPRAPVTEAERTALARAFARLDPVALAVAVGVVSGVGLWAATVGLVLRGGPNVGFHLGRLAWFLPLYDVTWAGAFIGAVEAGALGAAAGAGMALLWNTYHRLFVALLIAREHRRDVRRELQQL